MNKPSHPLSKWAKHNAGLKKPPVFRLKSFPAEPKPRQNLNGYGLKCRQGLRSAIWNKCYAIIVYTRFCEEASMSDLNECFSGGTATFMIMGDICTRRCPFCDVAHGRQIHWMRKSLWISRNGRWDEIEICGDYFSRPRWFNAMVAQGILWIVFVQCVNTRQKRGLRC